MTQEEQNVQTLQALYASLMASDWEGVFAPLAEDVELVYHGPEELPMAGFYQGKEGVRRFFETVAANIDRSPEDCGAVVRHVVAQGEKVIAVGTDCVCWGPEKRRYDSWWVHVFVFQDGKIHRMEEFVDTQHSMAVMLA